jgi:hypothetical protein
VDHSSGSIARLLQHLASPMILAVALESDRAADVPALGLVQGNDGISPGGRLDNFYVSAYLPAAIASEAAWEGH